MLTRRCSMLACAAVLAGCTGAFAQAPPGEPVSLAEALQASRSTAASVQGAQLDAQARRLQAEALANLTGPAVSLTGFTGRVSTTLNFDASRLANAVNPLIGTVDAAVPALDIPPVPQVLSVPRTFNLRSLGLSADWPLYTGGRLEAVQGLAAGRAHEAEADAREAEDQAATTTAERYFSVQLARAALAVRRAALADIAQHQRNALQMEETGLVAHADRLKADVALDDARRELAKAQGDLALAEVALQRHLGAPGPVQPTTPLFVHSASVGTLQDFIAAGLRQHPGWTRIAAKREQAEQSLRLAGGEHAPTVVALGSYNFNRSNDQLVQPNWFVGIVLHVPLVGHFDRGRAADAARLQQRRVELSAAQAGRDIPTLVEKQWRAMEDARVRYLTMDSSIALARENLRLQVSAYRHAQNTSLDVTDARVNLRKAETERLQAAYDYVLALARLLEASGEPERLPLLAASADVRVEGGAP